MKTIVPMLISENEFKTDIDSILLFEDEHSFVFAKIEVEGISFKFSWNSKGVAPAVKLIDNTDLVFIGVDTFVVGYNYKKRLISFFLNTSTNFKWFDKITNGVGIITETSVILINTNSQCTLRGFFFFEEIIMGTKIADDKMRISFLGSNDKTIRVF